MRRSFLTDGASLLGSAALPSSPRVAPSAPRTFVLVPGAWFGGGFYGFEFEDLNDVILVGHGSPAPETFDAMGASRGSVSEWIHRHATPHPLGTFESPLPITAVVPDDVVRVLAAVI